MELNFVIYYDFAERGKKIIVHVYLRFYEITQLGVEEYVVVMSILC